ncbi:MOSC domain-containing protein [Maliponia aquimaris]|uniref:MOSC domain protein n=1 Tax=Maliponia aquimaris TaxID=1673631 RepID=A0A238KRA0_9RHOB|nr:MOSC domain-containing protein [Maliponia aquimaris]SMX45141.1 MOSC domain protein [Maliponia aquimaris]
MAELLRSFAGPGRLDWIGLRPARLAPLVSVDRAEITAEGLTGDHGRSGKRAVTLIQAEHLPVIAALSGADWITAADLRRNLVISGINLAALREVDLRIGEVRLRITGPCAPCSRMETLMGPGGYTAMRGHGGWCCTVVDGGGISPGDAVRPES